jgi:very-short-patch-repair endonuclease
VQFDDDNARVAAFEAFGQQWATWADREKSDSPVRRIYDALLHLRTLMEGQSERYELVVADGLLTWPAPTGRICHPLIARRVDIKVDTLHQQVVILDTAQPTVPLFGCLRGQNLIPGTAIAAAQAEVRGNDLHPLDAGATSLLMAIRNRWFHSRLPGRPSISRYPLVLLIDSAEKASPMLDGIISDLVSRAAKDAEEARADLPAAIRTIVGDADVTASTTASEGEQTVADTDPDDPEQRILFTKPANVEQARIIAHLRRRPSVVVLGPPGTGKTHTIANLVGHFLAEGKTILVTSETAKALGEVRNKVVPRLQPLCVPLLGSDQESRNELEKCVHGIVDHLQRSTKAELSARAERLEAERRTLAEELQTLRRRLLDVHLSEVSSIVVGGEAIETIQAAQWVADTCNDNSWIPSGVTPGISCPLDHAGIREVYETNVELTAEEEQELAGPLPDLADVPQPHELAGLIHKNASLKERAETSLHGWVRKPQATDRAELESLRESIARLSGVGAQKWMLSVVIDSAVDNPRRRLWTDLVAAQEAASAAAVEADRRGVGHVIEIGGSANEAEDLEVCREIRSHLASGGSLSFWNLVRKSAWKVSLDRWRVDGHAPKRVDHIQAIEALLVVRQSRRRLIGLWRQLIASEDGPSSDALGKQPERAATQAIAHVKALLDWRASSWGPVRETARRVGIDWSLLSTEGGIRIGAHADLERELAVLTEEVLPRVERRLAQLDREAIGVEHARVKTQHKCLTERHPSSKILGRLLRGWSQPDLAAYSKAHAELAALLHKRPRFDRRKSLLSKLREAAPMWAAEIQRRSPPHTGPAVPGDVAKAWKWRQLADELDRRNAENLQALMAEIERKSIKLLDLTADLVAALAWTKQHDRADGSARRALNSWLQTMNSARGQRVSEMLAKARKLLVQARNAVPVWIMPLDRAYQVLLPDVRPRFDVVIVDEASQVGPEGLALLYLGRQTIVVGDDQQVTPLAIGETIASMDQLRAQYLPGIPSAHLYDGRRSLYGVAVESFAATVSLREHFRCVPDIIRFSNHLCYIPRGQSVLPLREAASGRVFPAVVPHRVAGRRNYPGKVNGVEARRAAALFGAMVQHPAYEGLTFGLISMLGSEQSVEIERQIHKYLALDDSVLERLKGQGGLTRKLCGEPPNFQGDERSVVIVSIVDSPTGNGPHRLMSQDTPVYRSRYNVAASRAQDQLWVVHSLDPGQDLQPSDLRKRLIDHALDPSRITDVTIEAQERAESPFEREVIEILVGRGYRVRPQYPAGAYRIDLVVEDGPRRLAVECDGERAHPPEQLAEDLRRQAILERRGWTFVRIRGSAFYRDRAGAMAPLFSRLEGLGIGPTSDLERRSQPSTATQPGAERVTEIVRRAEALEQEWARRDVEADQPGAPRVAPIHSGRAWNRGQA